MWYSEITRVMMRKASVIYIIFVLGVTSFFGIQMGMKHDNVQMEMMGCIFVNEPNDMCPMTISEHISKWRDTFLATFTGEITLLAGLAFVAIVFLKIFSAVFKIPIAYRLYRRDHPNISIFTPLFLAYSRGIIQPRHFA